MKTARWGISARFASGRVAHSNRFGFLAAGLVAWGMAILPSAAQPILTTPEEPAYLTEGLLGRGITYDDINPTVRNPTPVERYEARRIEAARLDGLKVSFWVAAGMAVQQQWILAGIFNGSARFAIDPNYRLTREMLAGLIEGLPEHYWDSFASAHSAAHAQSLREDALEDMRRTEVLAAMGLLGVAVSFGAAVLDPVFLLVVGGFIFSVERLASHRRNNRRETPKAGLHDAI